ncbi:MAG TPA: hypothetical protein VHA14_07700 [Bryobacteraceae bacterium]|nr:hypothetical protein [Bryobacteraceae bacterium]
MKKNYRALSLVAMSIAIVPAQNPQQVREYEADVPKTILELQQFRESNSIAIHTKSGRDGTATLVNLNPAINAWYLLKLSWKSGGPEVSYHLENANSRSTRILLDEKNASGLVVTEGGSRHLCDLFGGTLLDQARTSQRVYYPLCDGRIYLRNATAGHRTTLETATDFLREHIWGGEKIIALGHVLMGETHRETGTLQGETRVAPSADSANLPLPAVIDPKYAARPLASQNLGIGVEGAPQTGMIAGAWYPAAGNPGVYVSILQPNLIDPSILAGYKNRVSNLDGVETASLAYLVAFDLDRFDLGYALGTEHPTVGWSGRTLDQMRNRALPGPDGIGSIKPLVATGLLNPGEAARAVSTFTAGFKREHGAFRYGELALRNHGSHYGFIEEGVVFSKLQPGLATIFIQTDGSLAMRTWTEADNALLRNIRHARQNGVPLIESGMPGRLVNQWGAGNWSGSEDRKLRTMRSGAAFETNGRKRFLIYAVFSDATPSAMARVFQAYRCDYAMLLDMNALEHTYMAVYRRSGSQLFVDHLLNGMSVLEKSASGEVIPRFLGYADNRDFFYVMRREGKR